MHISKVVEIFKQKDFNQLYQDPEDKLAYMFINLSIKKIYTEFHLLDQTFHIAVLKDTAIYKLPGKANGIREAIDKNGQSIPINDYNAAILGNRRVIFTHDPYTVEINPEEFGGETITMRLNMAPPEITKENVNDIDLQIPDNLLEVILNYAGYEAYIMYNAKDEIGTKVQWLRYKQAYNQALSSSSLNQRVPSDVRFNKRGFE